MGIYIQYRYIYIYIYRYMQKNVVLASEPVGGRSRVTELPCSTDNSFDEQVITYHDLILV